MSRRAAASLAVLSLSVLLALTPLTGAAHTMSASGTTSAAPAAERADRRGAAVEERQRGGDRGSLDLRRVVGEPARPNILVLMLDDMRDDDLRFMPNVRRLITEQGVRFTNSFSPHPLCCPARASFLTGKYTHNHEVWSNVAPHGFHAFHDSETLPVWLSEVGYETSFLGKYLNGYGHLDTPSGKPSLRYVPPGWAEWRGAVAVSEDEGAQLAGGPYRYFDTTLNANGQLEPHEGAYQTHLYSRLTQQMIREAALSPRPFFSWVSFTAPHSGAPREPDDPGPATWPGGVRVGFPTAARPDQVKDRFDNEITRLPGAGDADRISEKPGFIRGRPPLAPEEVTAVLEVYRQRVESLAIVDQAVADIIASLRRSGQLDDTYVALTSDNGFFLGEHRIRLGKAVPYDPALRVPLVIRGPGIPAGEVRTDPFRTIDLAPTFLEMAGAQSRGNLDGLSRLGIAKNGDRGWSRGILTETGPRVVRASLERQADLVADGGHGRPLRFSIGLRTGRYLYVDHTTGERELYDMRRDPRQLDNLAPERGYQSLVRALAGELERLRDCEGPGCRVRLPEELRTDTPAPRPIPDIRPD